MMLLMIFLKNWMILNYEIQSYHYRNSKEGSARYLILDRISIKEYRYRKKFINELREAIRKLSIFSRSGSIPEDSIIKSSGFRFIVHKNYLIFYSIEESEKTVRIMAVFNSRQDYMRVITKFI